MTLLSNRYQLAEVIGSGGMSEVYAAQDTLIGRDVAVKMLRPELARDISFRERFRREAQNSGRLNHPAIVAVYDTGETDMDGTDVPYIVMERVHGRTLRDIIREEGPLEPARAAEILIPVSEALQVSHDAGIIHRDVKPANIMITNTGEVKVMDFGIARALDDSTSAMTQTSAVIGTAQYLSPEQARGKAADGRSDVYALGCVLYELLTSRPPFEGETPFAVAYQHVQEEPDAPSSLISTPLSPTAAVNVDAVVLTAMAKHPADRYQSAAAMGDDLRKLARNAVTDAARHHITTVEPAEESEDTPTTLTAAVPARRERAAQRSNRWMVWLAALLTLIAVGVGGAFVWDMQRNGGAGTLSQTVAVPDVTGLPRQEAVTRLEELELRVDINEEPSPDVTRGEVIRTNPTAGSQLQRGTTVTLTVSSGLEITDVPDLIGLTPQEAADALTEADLLLEQHVEEEVSETVPTGQITDQNPPAGSQISKGSRVTITVSTGPALIRVPALTGMQIGQAEATLSSLGLTSRVSMVDSAEPEGSVVSVSDEGTEVPRGTTITLQVSAGLALTMPDITRLDESKALDYLREQGWTGRLITGDPVATGALLDTGLIAVSEPAEGTRIRSNQDITVRYWEFDVGVLVPGA
ncbi:Stk1 family PASTA domain-containing Ser/Thr kinase [Corynebacterium hylobatis]|uniref:non-specific serine/threonine protein kinase n=1 Tax=Corynebacterium hylobatis TaxID=1859290 RepID=A0A3S0AVC7_9CORY|nr:Stk1 family PASTA domain-containing Ser/Thr kinase [Corynebacterium hylobatis]RSZ61905.1 Stk1 family PASTA domain-containing Ser/Thr kinase [Corynebacterium hylobatis]